ncbi:MAG: arginase [Chloroflexi bacterium]|nr:arginase [Chloroflexota bacterium]MCC6896946.1 arginase [Anaerolineae bacterium]
MSQTAKAISIFGVPMDLGQSRRGVDMGPSAIRYAGLQTRLQTLGYSVRDAGNISVPIIEELQHLPNNVKMHNAAAIASVCYTTHDAVQEALERGEQVVVLGGDHSVALGSVAATLDSFERVGVLWIDAHGDFNTPDITPSGNVHGMVVTSLMGKCPPPLLIGERRLQANRIVMIATRDLDPAEKVAIRDANVQVMSMSEIDENGMAHQLRAALRLLSDVDTLHVSFDMDSLDPSVAPGVGTPVSGGLTVREAHLIMELLADDGRVRTLDLVEVNPILDERNRTAEVAVDLAASLFGQRII